MSFDPLLPPPPKKQKSSIGEDLLPLPPKKKGNDGITDSTPTSVPLISQSQDGADVKAEVNPYDNQSPVDLSLQSDKLRKETTDIPLSIGATGVPVNSVVPNQESIDKADKIDKYLSSKKIDSKKVNNLFGDIPEQAYDVTDDNGNKNQTKEKLFDDWTKTPIDAESKIGNIKTQFNLQNQAYNNALDNGVSEHEAQQYGIQLGSAFNELHKQPLHSVDDLYQNITKQQQLINKNLTGEQRDKALEQVKNSSGKFINTNQPSLVEEYNNSDLKSLVNADEYAGLKTLQLFEPEKYQSAINILHSTVTPQYDTPLNLPSGTMAPQYAQLSSTYQTPDSTKGGKLSQTTINQQIGQETIHRQLLDIGRNNAMTQLNSEQYNLNKVHEQTTDVDEKNKIAAQYLSNQQKINGIKTEAQGDDAVYPLTAKLKFDNQVKELSQSAGVGAVEYGTNRFLKGFANTGETVEDMLTGLFGSNQASTNLQMKRMGEAQDWESTMYLPENLKSTGSQFILKPSKELKAQADEILKGRKITDLSTEEKTKLTDLVGNNQDQLETITNPDAGKSKNFFSKSTLYNTAGFTGDVASFMAQTAGLGALGMSSKAAELTTLFDGAYSPSYNQAISEGKSPAMANQYGMLHGGIMMLAGVVSSKYDAVKEMLAQGKSPLAQEIAGMGEAAWNKATNNKQGVINKIKNSLKNVATENAKMIATYGVGTSIVGDLADKGFFNKKISTEEIINHAVESSKDMALGGMAMAGAGFFMHLAKNPMTLKDKAMLWENGDNPEIGKAKIDEAVANNKLTQQEGDIRKKAIDKMSAVIQKVPEKNDRGKDLTDKERIEYGYNLFLKDKSKEAVSDLPPKQGEDAEMQGLIAEHKNQILLSQPTDKQLESRKNALEKLLEPPTGDEKNGKDAVLSEDATKNAKAELEAVNDAIKNKSKNISSPLNTNQDGKTNEADAQAEKIIGQSDTNVGADQQSAPLVTDEEKKLLEPHKDNITLSGMDDNQKLKFIAEQAQNISPDGTKLEGDARQSTENAFGKDLVEAAIKKYPAPIVDNPAQENKNNLVTLQNKNQQDANDIITGKKIFKRFSQAEQRGIADGGSIHAEASLILAREEGTGGKDAATNEEQEGHIEDYAKKKGVWIENPTETLTKEYGKPFASGEEALVFDNGDTVVKLQNTHQYGDLQRKFDSITLQNTMFPETSVKVLGYGRDAKTGDFQIIVEQPFVHADETGINDASNSVQAAKKKELGKEFMKNHGFENVEKNDYSNDQTLISDLHNGNFVITPEGKVAVIDPVMGLNTAEEGYGGKRVSENKIEENQSTKPAVIMPGDAAKQFGQAENPPEGNDKPSVHVDHPKTILTHRGLQEIATEIGGEDVTPRERESRLRQLKEADNEISDWQENGTYDKNINDIIDRAKEGKIDEVEQKILANHLATLREERRAITNTNSTAFKNKTAEIAKVLDAAKTMRSKAGGLLGDKAFGTSTPRDYSSPTAMQESVEHVTNEPINAEQTKKIKELTELNKKLQKQADDAEKLTIAENNKAHNGDEPTKPTKSKKSHEDYVKERANAFEAARKALKDLRSGKGGLGVSVPLVRELAAIAPHVATAVKSLIAEGVNKLGDIVDRIHDEFKDDIKGLRRRDIMDVIAGDHDTKTDKKLNPDSEKLADIKKQSNLTKKLQDLQNDLPEDYDSNKKEPSDEVKKLLEQIKKVKTDLADVKKKVETPKVELTPEEQKIKNLEKQRDDLVAQNFKQKDGKPDLKLTDEQKQKVKDLEDEIDDLKKKYGLAKGKVEKPLTEQEQIDEYNKELEELQNKFAGHKGTKFTPEQAKSIWNYAKKNYLNKSVPYRDMIKQVSKDLGLSWKQTSEAITAPKVKPISDAMWKEQGKLNRSQSITKKWIDDQSRNIYVRSFLKASADVRGLQVFGHAGVFMGTHAGMTLANPLQWHITIPAFFRAYKFAYGNEAAYERSLEELKSRPLYNRFERLGLKNNPDQINTEEFQKSQSALGGKIKEIGLQGIKGFNALKVLRQDLSEYHYNKLTEEEKQDDGAVKSIVKLVNNATGATNLKIPEVINEVTFAGGMEAARWGKLTRNPLNATRIALKALIHPDKVSVEDRVFAKVWASRVGWELGTYGSLLLANAAIQKVISPNNPTNLFNPNDKDWLRPKFGNTTIDPTSGMMSTVDFIHKLGEIPFEDKKELHGDTKTQAYGKAIIGRTRGKLAPLYSRIFDMITQTDYNGNQLPLSNIKPDSKHRDVGWLEYATQSLPIPIAEGLHNLFQSAHDNGTSPADASNIFQSFMLTGISGTTGARANTSQKASDSGSGGGGGASGGQLVPKKGTIVTNSGKTVTSGNGKLVEAK